MAAPIRPDTMTPGEGSRGPSVEERLLRIISPDAGGDESKKPDQQTGDEGAGETPPDDGQQSGKDEGAGGEASETPPDDAAATGEGADDQPKPDAQTPPLTTVVIDGKVRQMTQDELIAHAQMGADYTQKTQALSAREQAVQAEAQAMRAAREQYVQRLAAADQYLTAMLGPEKDWAKLRTEMGDAEFAAEYASHMQQRERLQAVQTELQRVSQQRYDDEQQQMAAFVAQERAKLLEAFPEWKEPTKATESQQALVRYGQSLGYSIDELASVVDHRALVVLHKAMLYDRLKAEGANLGPRSPQAKPPVAPVKPGAKQTPPKKPTDADAARARLKKTGDVHDAAAFFFETLKEK